MISFDHVENNVMDPIHNLKDYTFCNFLKDEVIIDFMNKLGKTPRMPTIRYLYLYYLCERVQEVTGDYRFCDFVIKIGDFGDHKPNMMQLYDTLDKMSLEDKTSLCLYLEYMTRGQSENILWIILRNGIISSSKLSNTIKKGACPMMFESNDLESEPYTAGPVAFGLRCEEAVKDVLSTLINTGQHKPNKNFGFMMSPNDGIYGMSLDFCTNTQVDNDDVVHFTPNSCIYEIKSRYKYLFSKAEFDPLYGAYTSMYNNPSKKTFITFINSIKKPAVEYVPDGRLPSESDYLLTTDKDWCTKICRKRKITSDHKDVESCIKFNHWAESILYILTDPSKTSGHIGIKDRLVLDVFINPRHPYYFQILLQYKIVDDYVHWGKFAKPGNYPPRAHIVSAFFRRRNSDDPQHCTIGADVQLDSVCEIPIAILITPVFIPKQFLGRVLFKCSGIWQSCADKIFKNSPWVSSSLFADDASP